MAAAASKHRVLLSVGPLPMQANMEEKGMGREEEDVGCLWKAHSFIININTMI